MLCHEQTCVVLGEIDDVALVCVRKVDSINDFRQFCRESNMHSHNLVPSRVGKDA